VGPLNDRGFAVGLVARDLDLVETTQNPVSVALPGLPRECVYHERFSFSDEGLGAASAVPSLA